MTAWMLHNEKENPLYSGLTTSSDLKNMRSPSRSATVCGRARSTMPPTGPRSRKRSSTGSLIKHMLKACRRSSRAGAYTVDEIETNVVLQKRVTNRKPFYMLGPLVTDIAPGYDDRVAAIGARSPRHTAPTSYAT